MTDKPTFAPEFWRTLAAENPLGSLQITEQDARDWFDLEWPTIREFYAESRKKPRWRLRITRCWANISPPVLQRAREYGIAARRSQSGAVLEALADRALSVQPDASGDASQLPPMRMGRPSE